MELLSLDGIKKKKVLWQKMIVFVKASLILTMLVNLHKNMHLI